MEDTKPQAEGHSGITGPLLCGEIKKGSEEVGMKSFFDISSSIIFFSFCIYVDHAHAGPARKKYERKRATTMACCMVFFYPPGLGVTGNLTCVGLALPRAGEAAEPTYRLRARHEQAARGPCTAGPCLCWTSRWEVWDARLASGRSRDEVVMYG